MIDFLKRLYALSVEGFEVGYFVFADEHLRFYLMHKDGEAVKIKLIVFVCYHFGDNPKFAFQLMVDGEQVYENKAETEGQLATVTGEINREVFLRLADKEKG